MEQVVLVDMDDNEVGIAEKIAAHRDSLLHRAFSVILMRGGEILLQQRNREKYHSGGLWANACCGHPRPGEPLAAAAERRLREEMGIACTLTWRARTHYQCALEDGMSENEIVHLFFGDYDGPVAPDPDEVMGWKWVDYGQFRDSAVGSEDLVYWVQDYVKKGLL